MAFNRLAAEMVTNVDHKDFIGAARAFAREHAGNRGLAARAHLLIIQYLVRAKDYDSAISEAKWLAEAMPDAEVARPYPFSYRLLPPMVREWKQYVQQRPIHVRDYAWFEIAKIQALAGRRNEQLAAYEHILRNVPPDELPDTKNSAIVHTFRLHKDTLDLKVQLLRRMGRRDEAKEAETVREALYPRDRWLALGEAAERALKGYEEAAAQEHARQAAIDEAEHRELEKSEAAARRRNEDDAAAQRKREEELRAKDEQRRLRYEEWKRRREERDRGKEGPQRKAEPGTAPEEKPEQAPPPPTAEKAKQDAAAPSLGKGVPAAKEE